MTQPLDATFSMLRGRANDSGGFGLWSSSPETAEFPTVYAAHFLVEAKDRGQKIPAEVLTASTTGSRGLRRRRPARLPTGGCAPTPCICWRGRASGPTPRSRTSSRS